MTLKQMVGSLIALGVSIGIPFFVIGIEDSFFAASCIVGGSIILAAVICVGVKLMVNEPIFPLIPKG